MSRGRSTITVTVHYSMNDHGEEGRRVAAAIAEAIRGSVALMRAVIAGAGADARIYSIDVEEVEG